MAARVMVSSTSPAYSLTIHSAASGSHALKVMTIVVVIFFPLVLLYQGWSSSSSRWCCCTRGGRITCSGSG